MSDSDSLLPEHAISLPNKGEEKVRASIAGHSFHWYIAVREALSLFSHDCDFAAIGLDGGAELVAGCEIADLIYYRRHSKKDASQDWVQIKYSRSKSAGAFSWSFMRPTVAKFFEIYLRGGTDAPHPDIDSFTFLTNRPANDNLSTFFHTDTTDKLEHELFAKIRRTLLEDVTDASENDLLDFLARINLKDSQKGLSDTVRSGTRRIRRFAPGRHPDGLMAILFEKIVACARSENAADRRVNRETVLMWLGYADPSDLLPAPAKFTPTLDPIPRPEIRLVESHLSSRPDCPLLIVAPGGVGKTVFMQQIAAELVRDHEVVLFDCFAGGEYRYAEDARHRAEIGLTHIINSLSLRGLVDPFLNPKKSPRFLRAVRNRLEEAAARVAEERQGARLIIMLDAADNSAQQGHDQQDDSFPCWLYQTLTERPIKGVSLILSCRDYRVELITSKAEPPRLDLPPFDKILTDELLDRRDPSLDPNARACLFAQSGGVPRVLDYLLRTGSGGANQPLEVVTVENILDERVDGAMAALDYGGAKAPDKASMLTALVRLPPPISLDTLSVGTGISVERLDSFLTALMPLIIRTADGITFRDEDAEVWARREADKHADALVLLTQRLDSAQESSIAAAFTLPQLLYEQREYQGLIDLALSDRYPGRLAGRVAQQRLHAIRLKTALKAAMLSNDLSMAVRILFELAIVRTTEKRTDGFVCNNPALAVLSDATQVDQRLTRSTRKDERHAFLPGRRLIAAVTVGNIDRAEIEARRYDDSLMSEGGNLDDSDTDALAALIALEVLRGDEDRAVRQAARILRPSVQFSVATRLLWFLQVRSLAFSSLCEAVITVSSSYDPPDIRGLALAILLHPRTEDRFRRPLAKIASKNWSSKEFSFSVKRYQPVEAPGINMAQALIRGAIECAKQNYKSATRQFLRAVDIPTPSVHDFSSDYGSEIVTEFFSVQCLKAYLNRRALRPKDCLPPTLARLADLRNAQDLDTLTRSLTQLHKTQNTKTNRQNLRKGALAHIDETDLRMLIWTARYLYSFGNNWLQSWGDAPSLSDNSLAISACEQLLNDPTDYKLYHKRTAQRRLQVRVSLLCLHTLPSSGISDAPIYRSVTDHMVKNVQYDFQILWTSWLALYPSLADKTLYASQLSKKSVLANTSVEARITHLGWITKAIAPCDQVSASTLVDVILDTLDGVGDDDFDILNGLLRLAQKQPGGRIPSHLAQRFFDVCEIHIYDEDKFPWPDIGRSGTSFGAGDILARLARWDGRDIARLSASLGLVLEALVNSKHLDPDYAYALSAIVPTAYWYYQRPATSAATIAKNSTYKASVAKSLHHQLIMRHGFQEGQTFADAMEMTFDMSPYWGGFGFWSKQLPQPIENDKTQFGDDTKIKLESAPQIKFSGTMSMTDSLSAILAHPDITHPYAKSDAVVLWGREMVKGPQQRREYLLSISTSSDLTFWAASRAIRYLSTDWQDFLPDIDQINRRCANECLRTNLAERDQSIGVLISKYAELSNQDIGTAAANCLETVLNQRVELSTEDAFDLADALMTSAPTEAHAAFVSLLSAPTLCLPEGQGEGGGAIGIAKCASDLSMPNTIAAFIWAQLGHSDAANRLGAGNAVCRLAELGKMNCLQSLIDAVGAKPIGDMWPLGVKFPFISARGTLIMALERAATLFPDNVCKIQSSIRLMRRRIDLTAAEQRTLDNALESLDAWGEQRMANYNLSPLSTLPRIPAPDNWWATGDQKLEDEFSFDYDFRKSEPDWTARMFGGGAIIDPPAVDQLVQTISEIDPDLKSMRDDGGSPQYQRGSRHHVQARFRRYGEQVVYSALERLGSRWLKQYSLIDDGNTGVDPEDWLKSFRPTSGTGVWLSDRTDLPPSFVSIPSVKTEDKPTFHDIEPILGALGISAPNSTGLVLAGRWFPSGGGSLSIFSALTPTWGSIKACKTFAKRPWHESYMPSLYHSRLHGGTNRTPEGFEAWLDEIEPELQRDRWDPLGSTAACSPFTLGSNFCESLGLIPHSQGIPQYLLSNRVVVGASAWGRDLSSSRHDADTTGKALLAERAHILDWLTKQNLSLIFKLERSYKHRDHWERGSYERLESNHLIRLTPGQALRTWSLPIYKPV